MRPSNFTFFRFSVTERFVAVKIGLQIKCIIIAPNMRKYADADL